MNKFECRIVDGNHVAVSLSSDGGVIAMSPPCASKFQAMKARDTARNEGVAVPKGWNAQQDEAPAKPPMPPGAAQTAPAPVPEAFAAFDHNGDGKPGGSLPKTKRQKKKPAKKADA